ncbi:hypothetical protein BDW42DRAFT_190484 [Aspergillus taichungensis]|uniref:Uncharacterized protein n=1 Tax=Aspergillus taichungensis TaxID=482145 RepID=A0A2J5I844_9EURO|nr:hypothetical protein BDW42DRAFT_190484 [Aspergillus taichungensis]
MSRTIHLALFSNGPKPAHYAVFIPTGDAGMKGKIIHVIGNTATGFALEFKRNYDFDLTRQRYQLIPLAQVNSQYIRDTVGNGQLSHDTIARDQLESAATMAPNCKDWMQDYVERLVAEGLVPSGAGLVVEGAPRLLPRLGVN